MDEKIEEFMDFLKTSDCQGIVIVKDKSSETISCVAINTPEGLHGLFLRMFTGLTGGTLGDVITETKKRAKR